MYRVRRWSVRNARLLEALYEAFEPLLVSMHPLLRRLGYSRAEKPIAWVESRIKGLLFDCRMCGQCVLRQTGMSCPMNCPKTLRNGPCGGVRPDGHCEVKPEMVCVWYEAYEGSRRMRNGGNIQTVQFAVDHRLQGRSSWLRVVREQRPETELSSQGSAGA